MFSEIPLDQNLLIQPQVDKVVMKLTNICNLECKHCYVSSHPKGNYGLDIQRALNIPKEVYDIFGRVIFSLSGGEALSRKKDAFKVLREAQKYHRTFLYTNATTINKKVAEELAKLDIEIQISIDGFNSEQHDHMRGRGTFQRTMNGINSLVEAGFPSDSIQIFSTVREASLESFESILTLAESYEIKKVKFEPVAKTGRARISWPLIPTTTDDPETRNYRSIMKTWNLPGWEKNKTNETGFRILKIYSDGSVLPYAFYDEDDKRFGTIGNVNENNLKRIIRSKKYSDVVISKFFNMASGPQRSLGAYRFIHESYNT